MKPYPYPRPYPNEVMPETRIHLDTLTCNSQAQQLTSPTARKSPREVAEFLRTYAQRHPIRTTE